MNSWYYTPDKQQLLGPFSSGQLRQFALAGTIRPEHLVMLEGTGKWVPAAKVKGLFSKPTQQGVREEVLDVLPADATSTPEIPQQIVYPIVPVSRAVELPKETREVKPAEEAVLDVLPADESPRSPTREILDSSGRYYLGTCLACGRQLRTPRREAGRITRCPSCRFFYRAPGRCRREDDGLPVVVKVSAFQLAWPDVCACCLLPHDDFLKVTHREYRMHGQGLTAALLAIANPDESWWKVPYCWECLEHVDSEKEKLTHKECSAVAPAVRYHGSHGTVHTFSFYNWQYANRFLLLNHDKCLG